MWFLTLFAACPKRAPDSAAAIQAAAVASDRAWAARAQNGLDPVGVPLASAWSLFPGDPELGWRLVRWRTAQGSAAPDPDAARDAFAQGRSEMLECLDADSLFAQQRREDGWGPAMAALPSERRACAAWGVLSWVRWTTDLGPAATSLDLPVIDAILHGLEGDVRVEEVADWARGLTLAQRPTWAGQDLGRAAQLLRQSAERDPESGLRKLDWFRVTHDPQILDEVRAMTLARPEDVGAWASWSQATEVR